MECFPQTIEEKLGFDIIREKLRSELLSALGNDALAGMQPSGRLEIVREQLDRVDELQNALAYDDPVPLDHVLDIRKVVRRAAPGETFVSGEDLYAVFLMLGTVWRLHDYFRRRREKYPRLAEVAAQLAPLPDVEEGIDRVVDDQGQVKDDASPALKRLRRLLNQKQHRLREVLNSALRKAISLGYTTEEQATVRGGRMVIPVRAEARRKVQGFVHDTSATGQTVYIEPSSCLDLNNEVREIEREEGREIERILKAATALVRAHQREILQNQDVLGTLDLIHARARVSREIQGTVPRLNDEGRLNIRQGINPVLFYHFKRLNRERGIERKVVPLTLELGAGYVTLIITGPNAGGKSVAMKTVGLLSLMLACGIPVPAHPSSDFCMFSKIFADIGDEQSIEEDLSTFSSHLRNLKYMLEHADDRTLVLIDEAGTGTDPTEGGALAQAILARFSEKGARTIATTHQGTLKAFAHEHDRVENGSMQFNQETLVPTYQFQAGIPGSSYAFEIAARLGLSDGILEQSRQLVGEKKTRLEDLIAAFETDRQALQQQLREAELTRRCLEEERSAYLARADELNRETEQIRSRAIKEAEQIIAESNAEIERTIREIKEAQAEQQATRSAREQLKAHRDRLLQPSEERSRTAGARPEPGAAGDIAVGDQVVLDEGSTVAEVLEIRDGEAEIAFGSMRVRAGLSRLNKVAGRRKQEIRVRQTVGSAGDALTSLKAKTTVDLRGKRVEEAIQEVTRLIDEAVASSADRLEILHGKGTGALRVAIHEYLNKHPDVKSYEEAPWNQGGAGITIVRL